MLFQNYQLWPRGGGPPVAVEQGLPGESDVVAPL